MKVLVAGGAGFIGSHLCRKLIEEGCDVICVDNLIAGEKEKVKDLFDHPKFAFIEQNVIKPFNNETMKQLINLNLVFHLASPASPEKYSKFPIETLLVNSQGTYNLLQLTVENKAKFLFASTSEIYGDPKEHPQKETYWGRVNPVGPRSCYDEGKRFGEAMTVAFLERFSLDAKIVRIFNTYGPGMSPDDGRVISNFILQALRGADLTVQGDGKQSRSFCYIDDMIEGLMKMIFSSESGPINLGNLEEISILGLAKKIIKITNSSSKIKFTPLPEDDPVRRQPDITLAREKLNWQPQVPLTEGLKKTIEYFKKKLSC